MRALKRPSSLPGPAGGGVPKVGTDLGLLSSRYLGWPAVEPGQKDKGTVPSRGIAGMQKAIHDLCSEKPLAGKNLWQGGFFAGRAARAPPEVLSDWVFLQQCLSFPPVYVPPALW